MPVRYRTFGCPVCSMLLSVTREQMGTKIRCPDCEREIIVPTYLDFDHPTDEEIRRERLDRQERDQLYSPMRNPNRVGLDLDSDSIYGIGDENSTQRAKQEKLIPVHCRICETLMYVKPEQVGQTIVCPDCGAKTVVTQALKEQIDTIETTFSTRDVGSYDLGAVPEAPSQTFQLPNGRMVTTNPNSSMNGQVAPSAPESTLTRVFRQTKQAKQTQASNASTSQSARSQDVPNDSKPLQTNAKPQNISTKPSRSTSSPSNPNDKQTSDGYWGQTFLNRANTASHESAKTAKTPSVNAQKQVGRAPSPRPTATVKEQMSAHKGNSTRQSMTPPRPQAPTSNQQMKTSSADAPTTDGESGVVTWFSSGANDRFNEFYKAYKSYLPSLVLRRRGENYVWAYPSPPKRAPMLNGTFKMTSDPNVLCWGAFLMAFGGLGAYILSTLIIPSIGPALQRGPASLSASVDMGIGTTSLYFLFLLYLVLTGRYFREMYDGACLGARKALPTPSDGGSSLIMSLLQGLWTLGIAITAMVPGLVTLAILGVSKGASFFELWTQRADSFHSLIPISLATSFSFWFFFPIFWLSTQQSSSFFAPISVNVWNSFATQTKNWIAFYTIVGLLGWLPSFIWGLFLANNIFWYAMPILLIYFTILLALTVGRLGWIIDDEIREMDYDD